MNKKWIIAGVVVIILVVAVKIFRKVNRKTSITNNWMFNKATGAAFPLYKGSSNSTAIRQLQTYLNGTCIKPPLSIEPLVIDGDFGPKTKAAVEICLGTKSNHTKDQVSKAELEALKQTYQNQVA